MKNNNPIIPDIEMSKLIVAEYSVQQNCFHIETLSKYLSNNIRSSIFRLGKSDFSLIGIFKTEKEADDYIELFKEYQKKADKDETERLINSIPEE